MNAELASKKSMRILHLHCLLPLVLITWCIRLSGQETSITYDQSGNTASVFSNGNTAPAIETEPETQLFQSNMLVSFSVIASGAGVSYQWLSNGVPIIGATGDTLYLPNIAGTNGIFSVIISNGFGSVTSTPAVIWADSNNNGIPDWWEMEYFGNLNQTADGDYDGDGVDNLDEYLEGTDPANANSYDPRLHIQSSHGLVVASPSQPYYTMGQLVTLTAIPDAGQEFISWGGSISGTKPEITLVMNSHKTITASFGLPLGVAIGDPNLVWTTGGSEPWFGQTEVSRNGIGAVQSGTVTSGEQSWLQTVVNFSQTSQFGFSWSVSSQSPDGVSFLIDGSTYASISGTGAGWQFVQDTNLPAGSHTLLWTYTKYSDDNPTGIPFSDSAWVGEFNLTTIGSSPQLTIQIPGKSSMLISWSAPSTGFILQENTNLLTATWVNVTNAVNLVNGTNQVSISASTKNLFFRLLYQ